ncbi:MAG: hypothetical protein R2838_02835 [Caldilineaceae bacterium]
MKRDRSTPTIVCLDLPSPTWHWCGIFVTIICRLKSAREMDVDTLALVEGTFIDETPISICRMRCSRASGLRHQGTRESGSTS